MRFEVVAATLLLTWCGAGCGSPPRLGRTLLAQPSMVADELAFWQALEGEARVTNDDALHGLLLLADGSDAHASFAARVVTAQARGWIAPDAALDADGVASVGMVSVAVCDLLALEGGVTRRFAPKSPRYCTRELVFRGLLPERTAQQGMRGLELIDLAGRVEDARLAMAGEKS